MQPEMVSYVDETLETSQKVRHFDEHRQAVRAMLHIQANWERLQVHTDGTVGDQVKTRAGRRLLTAC